LDGKERRVLLVRHCEVEECYREVCYGRADVGLSEYGRNRSRDLARQLETFSIAQVWHSNLSRTRFLVEALAALARVRAIACPLLRERDFGAWELRPWQEIYAETGDAMLGMIREPAVWRPPEGETTFEMRDRVLAWFRALPSSGAIVAVTHGGPIAILRGVLAGRPVSEWPGLIPATGSVVEL
jgi:broad specificity phosphatase PhoE